MPTLFKCTFVVWFGFVEEFFARGDVGDWSADGCWYVFYYCGRMVGIAVDVESFVVGFSVWIVGSVREVYGDVEEVSDL